MYKHETTTNLADFNPTGKLGLLFARAKMFNHYNDQLSKTLPDGLKSLSLCVIEGDLATFVADNQASAFVAQKQHKTLLSALQKIDGLAKIRKIAVKVSINTAH